ncbi:MAG TPA: imidazole glycerol phosphate synthase subunit HisH [Ktedonobacterales bacterium]|nr:imidazole glycerol phosphate synthase subunit HisH [Ktedonobacterales bacterium]
MIVVVDYGAANLLSITRALEACGAPVAVSDSPSVIAAADGVVLPGVGAAGSAMERLRASGADAALRRIADAGRPLLGVCLGMQLFFERLEEDGATGLGLLPGAVTLLPPGRKIPHMGWNTLTWAPGAPGTALFSGLQPGVHAYFVHSYACVPANSVHAAAWTEYGEPLCAAVAMGGLYGVQFHPEKSGAAGLRMLANWLALVTAQPAYLTEVGECRP